MNNGENPGAQPKRLRLRLVPHPSRLLLYVGILVHLTFFLSLATGFLNPLFDDSAHRRGQGADFFSVYQAGRNLIDGVSVYAPKPETVVVPYWYPYRYHPFTAYTFGLAFQLFTPALAYTLWILLQEFLLFINILLTRRLMKSPGEADTGSSLWLLFTPFYLELYMGQFSFLMTSLLFWTLVAWERRRTRLGDGAWIISLMVKSNSAILAPVLLRFGRWKPVLLGILFVLVCSVPYFAIVPDSLRAFAVNFTEGMKVQTLAGNQGSAALLGVLVLRLGGLWPDSIFEVVTRLDSLSAALFVPTMLWVVLIGLVGIYLTLKQDRSVFLELCLLWLITYFLLYKHVWEHQYVMMLPVFVVLLWKWGKDFGGRKLVRVLFWASFVIIALPTPFVFLDKQYVIADPEYYWTTLESLAFHAPKAVAVLALYIGVCILLWKRRAGSAGKMGLES